MTAYYPCLVNPGVHSSCLFNVPPYSPTTHCVACCPVCLFSCCSCVEHLRKWAGDSQACCGARKLGVLVLLLLLHVTQQHTASPAGLQHHCHTFIGCMHASHTTVWTLVVRALVVCSAQQPDCTSCRPHWFDARIGAHTLVFMYMLSRPALTVCPMCSFCWPLMGKALRRWHVVCNNETPWVGLSVVRARLSVSVLGRT